MAELDFARGLTLTPQDVALYFVDYSGSESVLKELTMDIFGNIENWPKDFFGDRGAEILAALEARAKRSGA